MVRALVVLALCLAGAPEAKPGRPGAQKKGEGTPAGSRQRSASVVMLLRTGRSLMAVQNARQSLARTPHNTELLTALAVGEARVGYYADAAATFAFSAGEPLYEELGIEAHATTLRACGDGEAAAALRLQRLLVPELTPQTELRVWMYAADDLWAAGDIGGALDMNEAGRAQFPRSSILHAQAAELHLALGDTDAADFHLWFSDQQGRQQRWHIAEGRRRLQLGDLVGAHEMADAFLTMSQPSARFAAFRAEVLIALGEADDAGYMLNFGRWRLTEDPEILVARMRVRIAQGDLTAAREVAARVRAIYPDNPAVVAALRELAATPR